MRSEGNQKFGRLFGCERGWITPCGSKPLGQRAIGGLKMCQEVLIEPAKASSLVEVFEAKAMSET